MSTPAPTSPPEERRLAALYECELLDTPSEDLFDAFTRLAAQLCETPIALISGASTNHPNEATRE